MPSTDEQLKAPEETVRNAAKDLLRWLVSAACPLWASRGFDDVQGAFHESLDSDARPACEPRRIRVQLRQVYSFARAASLGWNGDAAGLVAAGLSYVRRHYRRPDGLFRTLVAPDGTSLDDRAFLYDQAFVLLALAESQRVLGRQPSLAAEGTALREALYGHLRRSAEGFCSGVTDDVVFLANPHMHLLEAALAWTEVSDDPAWQSLADEIGALALGRFIDTRTGALREQFAADWTPLGPDAGPVVEPGHQFEWAWLLFRWSRGAAGGVFRSAERLAEIGEKYGIRGGVAVNALLEDLSVSDGAARLWPQTERLKASVYLAKHLQQPHRWHTTAQAIAGLSRFLDTRTPGLWHDRLTPDGDLIPGRAPGSSFYHIVCAIAELAAACEPPP
jgi:mannose/cellobiose epimerase-like protein (N-acyl-D-glucosamine 2-epimerase family)